MRWGILFALVFLVSVVPMAQAEECRLLKLATLEMTYAEGGTPIVPVSINGTARKFAVSTANAFSGISAAVAEELGLRSSKIGSHRLVSSSGNKVTRMAYIETLGLGDSRAKNARLMILDLDGVDGVLSTDYLMNFDLDSDFAANVLNLLSQEHCKGRVVYWTKAYVSVPFSLSRDNNRIVVPMMLDGQKVDTSLSTASANTTLSMMSAKRLFGLREDSPGLEPNPDGSETIPYRRRFGSLSIEGLEVKNPLIHIYADNAMKEFQKDMSVAERFDPAYRVDIEHQDMGVGMNILSRLHLYIAYREKMLYLSAADAH